MKILFITSTRIGDAVLSTGLLGWLIERYPEARVTVACGAPAAPLFAALPGLEEAIVLRKRPGGLHWLDLWRATVGVRWDLVVDLRRSAIGWLLRTRKHHRLPAGTAPLHRVALVGEDLLITFAVLRQAVLFIGNDSGLMHMAAAAGVPTLGLFGPTDERLYGPWGSACAVARDATETPMPSLTVDAVERAALALYARTGAPDRVQAS